MHTHAHMYLSIYTPERIHMYINYHQWERDFKHFQKTTQTQARGRLSLSGVECSPERSPKGPGIVEEGADPSGKTPGKA